MRAAAFVRGLREHADERALREPCGGVDVVRGEVLHHADVRDPSREGPLAPGDDLVDLSKLTEVETTPELLECGVEPLDVPDSADEPALEERGSDAAAGLRVDRNGLLDEAVHPRVSEFDRDFLVEDRGDCDDGGVDPEFDERGDRGDDREPVSDAEAVARGIRDADEVDAVQGAEYTCVMAAHHPEPDEAHAER